MRPRAGHAKRRTALPGGGQQPEPQIVRTGQTRLEGFNEQIIALCARGMTVRDIRAHLCEMYGVDVSPPMKPATITYTDDQTLPPKVRQSRCIFSPDRYHQVDMALPMPRAGRCTVRWLIRCRAGPWRFAVDGAVCRAELGAELAGVGVMQVVEDGQRPPPGILGLP